jgi:hypothetical protein
LEHPPADIGDQAGVFEDGDEVVGLHHSPVGMAPAQQCLDAGRLATPQVEDRLVGQEELLAGERVTQIHLKEDAVLDDRVHFGLEYDEAVLACGLGLV